MLTSTDHPHLHWIPAWSNGRRPGGAGAVQRKAPQAPKVGNGAVVGALGGPSADSPVWVIEIWLVVWNMELVIIDDDTGYGIDYIDYIGFDTLVGGDWNIVENHRKTIGNGGLPLDYLVGGDWNMTFFPIYWEFPHPN